MGIFGNFFKKSKEMDQTGQNLNKHSLDAIAQTEANDALTDDVLANPDARVEEGEVVSPELSEEQLEGVRAAAGTTPEETKMAVDEQRDYINGLPKSSDELSEKDLSGMNFGYPNQPVDFNGVDINGVKFDGSNNQAKR